MSNKIERIPGYSNSMMIEHYQRLLRIMNNTDESRSRKRKSNFHCDDARIIDNLKESIDFFKSAPELNLEIERIPDKFEFWPYQENIIETALFTLNTHGMVYLAMEVRTGKTLTALGIAQKMEASNVLFLTKKKAISSIEDDYKRLCPSYYIRVVNYESLHLYNSEKKWDFLVLDEAHSLGAFPKPSGRAIDVGNIIEKYSPYVILLSGTPTPESYSQMYHQVYKIPTNPFSEYKTFYKFASNYVNVKKMMIGGMPCNDYSDGKDSIVEAMEPYMITYTQADAGFISNIEEKILTVPLMSETYRIIDKLKKDLVVQGKKNVILGDTPVKLMNKLHQLYSGTIKFESGESMVIDDSKARYIKEYFSGARIGVFYKFKEELNALSSVFGSALTTDLSVFKNTDCQVIALQIVSGREGISLKEADYLVYFNIDFSATSYWQGRDRMTTKDRPSNKVFWVFSFSEAHGPGIEFDVYNAVSKKKDYTVNIFRKK
jgi:hypothetical protein